MPSASNRATEYPDAVQRQISKLRWTGVVIWVGWVAIALPLYWAFTRLPHTAELMQLVSAGIAILSLGVFWFIFTIYRLGAVVEGIEETDD